MGFLRAATSLQTLAAAELTYPEHGATRGALPPGYAHVQRHETIGTGEDAFERAAEALSGWAIHRRAGLTVNASCPTAQPGTVVVLTMGWRGFSVVAPCRVVYNVNETDRRGFAYGTLPGHPERGEEAFVVEMTPAAEVRLTIRAFSQPASLLTRAGGPLSRKIQDLVTDRYVHALRLLVQR